MPAVWDAVGCKLYIVVDRRWAVGCRHSLYIGAAAYLYTGELWLALLVVVGLELDELVKDLRCFLACLGVLEHGVVKQRSTNSQLFITRTNKRSKIL